MFKNGKLFGKINLFDAAMLLLVILLIIAGILKFKTFNETVDAATPGKITYDIIIKNIREYTVDAFVSGDIVYDSATNINIGTIIKVEAQDARIANILADGKVEISENPYKKDLILTIEASGTSTDSGYFVNKSIELKVGSEKKIETLYATTTGRILNIAYNEGEE